MNIHKKNIRALLILFAGLLGITAAKYTSFTKTGFINRFSAGYPSTTADTAVTNSFFTELARAAELQTKEHVVYDGAYYKIDFPMGDIDPGKGVCTDVVIRSYRVLNVDLQERVHYDMAEHFLLYPKIWRLTKPDPNIDHRRVPNLMVFFQRKGKCLPTTDHPADYAPGDIVTWDLGAGLMHIGMVSTRKSAETGNPLIVHNIGAGPVIEDMLFHYKIIGHFRYNPNEAVLSVARLFTPVNAMNGW